MLTPSNGNFSPLESHLDPTAGFDGVFPEITAADAYASEFYTAVGDIAEEFDTLATAIDGVIREELTAVSDEAVPLRTVMFDLVDRPLQRYVNQAAELTASMQDVVDDEFASVLSDLSRLPLRCAQAGLPPADPFGFDANLACDPNNAQALIAYHTALLEWLLTADPDLWQIVSAQLTTPVQFSAPVARTVQDCHVQIVYYLCGSAPIPPQPPGPPPGPPPDVQPSPDVCLANHPFLNAVPGTLVSDYLPGRVPFRESGLTLATSDLLYQATELRPPNRITIHVVRVVQAGACQPATLSGQCDRNGWVWGLNTTGAIYPCAESIQPPTPTPQPIPGPPPTPEPGDWIERLCECLNRNEGKALDVWVNCETCEVQVLDVEDDELDEPWRKVVEIDAAGEAMYLEQCETVPAENGNGEPQPPKLPVPPQIAELAKQLCVIPKTLSFPAGVQETFRIGSFSAAVAFTALSLVPQNVLISIKPDGALIALAALFGMMGLSSQLAADFADKLGCGPEVKELVFTRQFMGLWERVLPGGFGEQIARITQTINNKCPSLLPTVDQAHNAYLSNEITLEVWRCWVRANGYVDTDQERVVRGQRTRPGVHDINMLLRRQLITNDDWNKRLRTDGVLDDVEAELMFQLTEQRPGMADIIRFMQRDADDEAVVQRFGLDDQFDQKYRRQLQQWARDQGIPDVIAQYAWRSHWTIPSPTQLYEMFHRLGRDNKGDTIPSFYADVRAALIQQDILPFWIDKLLAVSYRLPTRVDVRRAYRIGIFTQQDVFEQYVKLGYEKKVCEGLTKFARQEMLQSWVNHRYVKAFIAGELSENETRDLLIELNAPQEARDFAIDWGREIIKINRRKQCLKAIRRRVFIGELDRQQALTLTHAQTADMDTSIDLVDSWFCERDASSKELTLRKVLELFREQIIDASDLFRRLIRLRYMPDDATAIVNRAVAELQRKLDEAEQKRLDKARREAERVTKETERLEKQRVKDSERTVKAREAAKRADERREVQLMQAAKLLSNRMSVAASTVIGPIAGAYRRMVHSGIVSAAQAADAAVKASGDTAATDVAEWETIWLALIEESIGAQTEGL